jgi:hypothetical protein
MTFLIRKDRAVEPLTFDLCIEPSPSSWNGPHVGLRLACAFTTLRAMPERGDYMAMSLQTMWPPDVHSFEIEDGAEQDHDEHAVEEENRTCVLLSPSEITNANKALAWPLKYLRDHPLLAKAVNAVARALAWARCRCGCQRTRRLCR